MKISTKGRYGLTIVVELGAKYGKGPVPLRQIAEEQALSEAYLEQLIPPLRNSGIVKSVRGAYGGYMLAKAPTEITAGDVIRVLEGPIQLVEGLEELRYSATGVLETDWGCSPRCTRYDNNRRSCEIR